MDEVFYYRVALAVVMLLYFLNNIVTHLQKNALRKQIEEQRDLMLDSNDSEIALIKSRVTTITKFEVIKITNDLESIGEILELSMFGEYCPDRSLRGYSLTFLLSNSDSYTPIEIVQKGEIINLKGGNNV